MSVHCVVTGRTADGKSVFVEDRQIEATTPALAPGTAFHQVWGSDEPVALPSDGAPPRWSGFFPPPAGFRFLIWSIGPDGVPIPDDVDVGAALAEMREALPGMLEVIEPDHPGMHTTDTIDFNVVLSGEAWLELDDGAEVRLTAGDCVVQNGTRHAWHNRTDAPVTVATTLVGASRAAG